MPDPDHATEDARDPDAAEHEAEQDAEREAEQDAEHAPPEQAEAVEGAGQDPADEAAAADAAAARDESADAERSTIRPGRNFEAEYRLGAAEAGDFLVELGEQLRGDDEVTLVGEAWELPFQFGEPVELEVEFEGTDDPELEIEVQLPYREDEGAPDVE